MNQIVIKNKIIEFEYIGYKIINFWNSTLFLKYLNDESNYIEIDNKIFKKLIIINDLTKVKDLFNLSKNSFYYQKIFQLLDKYPIINYENLSLIVEQLNNETNLSLLSSNDGDLNKIVNLLFDLDYDNYLNNDILELFLKSNILDQKQLIIFENLSWINEINLNKYFNNFYFLILTNDFRNILNSNPAELETILIINENLDYIDILDYAKCLSYLELKLNIEINNDVYKTFINDKNSEVSNKMYWLIKNFI